MKLFRVKTFTKENDKFFTSKMEMFFFQLSFDQQNEIV